MAIGNVIEEFFVALGFNVNTDGLASLSRHTELGKKLLIGLGAAATAAAASIGVLTVSVADHLDELFDFSAQENVSAETIQALGYAAHQTGGSIEAVKNSISGMNRVIGEAATGLGRGAKYFEHYGISVKDSAGQVKPFEQILGEIANKLQGLSKSEQIAMAEKLGIDREFINTLLLGRDGLKALTDEAYDLGFVIKDSSGEIVGNFQSQWKALTWTIAGVRDAIGLAFMPEMTKALEKIKEWWKVNQVAVKGGLVEFFSDLGVVLSVIYRIAERVFNILLPLFVRIGAVFDNWLDKSDGLINVGLDEFLGELAYRLAVLVSWFLDLIDGAAILIGKFKELKHANDILAAAIGVLITYKAGAVFLSLASAAIQAGVALSAFSVSAALATFGVGALIMMIGLIADQIYSWMTGTKSYIDTIIESFPEIVPVIEWTLAAIIAASTIALLRIQTTATFAWAQTIGHIIGIGLRWAWLGTQALFHAARVAAAWFIAMGPVAWVAAGVVAAGLLIWANWDKLSKFIPEVWDKAFMAVKNIAQPIFDFIGMWIDRIKDKFKMFADSAADLGRRIAGKIGININEPVITKPNINEPVITHPNIQKQNSKRNTATEPLLNKPALELSELPLILQGATSPPLFNVMPKNGILGAAGGGVINNNEQTNSTHINVGGIRIESPDPSKSGESVKKELQRIEKTHTRNAQSQVLI